MNASPFDEQGPPPSYDAAGPQEGSLPPLTGVNHSIDSAWPSAASEKEHEDDEDDDADEPLSSGTTYSLGGGAKTRGGYTAIPINQEQDDAGRGSIDGLLRDDFPVRTREGPSVRVEAQEAWIQDPDQLCESCYGFNGQSELPLN
jgi:hypothetical protein